MKLGKILLMIATGMVFPAFASYKNLVVNGTFDSGSLAPWVRNTTVGRAGKQGSAEVFARPRSNYILNTLDCGSHALGLASYVYPNNSTWYNSTDTYVSQSITVEDVGTYLISFDYVGRAHSEDKYWNNAESYVRIFKGEDITTEPIYIGAFTPVSKTEFANFNVRIRIKEPGVYTIQFLRPEPVGSGDIDKCVIIDNVVFAFDDADNLVRNGRFDAGSVLLDPTKGQTQTRPDADGNSSSSPGYQPGKIPPGHNNPCWNSSGTVGLGKRNASFVLNDPLVGECAFHIQTYYFDGSNARTFGNSTDAFLWQSFNVAAGGTYELSFDYAGRNGASYLYGATLYVRLYKGSDRTATPVYEGSVVPTQRNMLLRSVAYISIADADIGDYTLEFFQPQPEAAGSDNDKAVVIDNIRFARTNGNIIQNGNFEQSPNGTEWSVTGNSEYYFSRSRSNWIAATIPVDRCALVIQTYNYIQTHGDSGDKSVWQPFDISSAGTYRLSFDYTGRNLSGFYGRQALVRIHSGEGIGGTVVFEGEFTPVVCMAFQHYADRVTLPAGRYTLEFFMTSPDTAGADETDKAVAIDNIVLEPVAASKVARWVGAVDGDVAKPENWDGNAVPDSDTIVYFTGNFAAQIPAGTVFECAGVVFAENAKLTAVQCDWSGLRNVEMSGALDVAGNRFIVSDLGGSAVFSSSVAGGVLEIATAAGDFVVNKSTVIEGANIRVEKTGAGTLISKAPQLYSGGTVVKGGIAYPLEATVDIYDGFKTFGAGRISVETNATFDGRGHYGYGNIFDLAGGMLTSSVKMDNTSRIGIGAGTLSATSYVRASSMVFGESGGKTDLCGNTLSVDVSDRFYLCNAIVTNGTIDVTHGGYLQTVAGKPVDASTVDLKANCALELSADLSVHNYVAIYAEDCNEGTAELKVYGTFKPSDHDYFRGCTMQNGSTIDLSLRTTALPLVSAFTSGNGTLKFAEDTTTVFVKTDGRSISSQTPVISWSAKPECIDFVKFKCADEGRHFSFIVKDDGLYPSSGLAIVIR